MKTWFITGAGRGLGRSLAEAALQRGDTVIGTRRRTSADALVGDRLRYVDLELDDAHAIDTAVEEAFSAGPVDVIVNNAGYGLLGPVEYASDEEAQRLFEINVMAPFRVVRAAIPKLRAQGGGHIVNVTSVAGWAPIAGTGLYAAMKAAAEALSQALVQELAPFDIHVTAVAPGTIATGFFGTESLARAGSADDLLYASTVGQTVERFDTIAGRETSDPVKIAEAILAVVDADDPPARLLLGSDALQRAEAAITATTREVARWSALTRSTDAQR